MEKALPNFMIMSIHDPIPSDYKGDPVLEHRFRSDAMAELQAELKQEIPERLEQKYQARLALEREKQKKEI